MGSILERVGQNVEKASEIQQQGLEKGEKDAQEIRELKSIIEGMDKGVDEDIVEAMDVVRESGKSEAMDDMNSDVHGTLEQGYDVGTEAVNEGTDQSDRSRQAAADFQSIAGVTEFGRSSAESSAAKAEDMAGQFSEYAEAAQQEMDSSEEHFRELADDIMG